MRKCEFDNFKEEYEKQPSEINSSKYEGNIKILNTETKSINLNKKENTLKSKRELFSRKSTKNNLNDSSKQTKENKTENINLIKPIQAENNININKKINFSSPRTENENFTNNLSFTDNNANILNTNRSILKNNSFSSKEKNNFPNYENLNIANINNSFSTINKDLSNSNNLNNNQLNISKKEENITEKKNSKIENDYNNSLKDYENIENYIDYNSSKCLENDKNKTIKENLSKSYNTERKRENIFEKNEKFHKKSYQDNINIKKSYDFIPYKALPSKNFKKLNDNLFGVSEKKIRNNSSEKNKIIEKPKNLENTSFELKNENKFHPTKNENSDFINYKFNDFYQDKENNNTNNINDSNKFTKKKYKKNFSESPKKNNIEFDNNLNEILTDPNFNNKRNYSTNNNIHTVNEESIELIIPTPYPKNPYMLIEDPNLLDSSYTKLLNKKYPQRKYLKHNLTSWLKCNGKHSKHLNVKFTNPKLDFKEIKLKKLSHKKEEILNNDTTESITDIKKALEIIENLKSKVLEYEITNNENIDLAKQHIEKIQHENNFYKEKILSTIEEINFYKDKYDDDILESHGLYDHKRYLVKNLRMKWLKHKFFYGLKDRLKYLRDLRERFLYFKKRTEFTLIFKGFLCLEKNLIKSVEKKKFLNKNNLHKKNKIFGVLNKNLKMQKLKKKFAHIQRHIILILTMKNLRYNLSLKKYINELNKKALFKYYINNSKKIFFILKYNIHAQASSLDYKKKAIETNKINFTNFFKNLKNGKKLTTIDKVKKTQALEKIKILIHKKNLKILKKFSNGKMKILYEKIFRKWKYKAIQPLKIKTFNFILAIKLMQLFFNKIKNILNIEKKKLNLKSSMNSFRNSFKNTYRNNLRELSPYSSGNSFMNSKRTLFNNFFNKCLKMIKTKKDNSSDKLYQFSRELYFRMFIDIIKNFQFNNPIKRFIRVHRKFQHTLFFDKIKTKIVENKKMKFLTKKISSFNQISKINFDIMSNFSGSTFFTERKNNLKNYNDKYNMNEKILFSFVKKFIKIVKYKSKIKEFYETKIKKFKKNFIYFKYIEIFLRNILLKKIFSNKNHYEKNIKNIKKIIEEKSDIILKIEQENNELRKYYENSRKETKFALIQNDDLKKKIKELEDKIDYNNLNFKELFSKNVNDIKSKKDFYLIFKIYKIY